MSRPMTPELKAIELVEKFSKEADDYGTPYPILLAKDCAVIAVDEIMRVVPYMDYERRFTSLEQINLDEPFFMSYWQQVKESIQKL